ncbi:MAG: hypothetical protein E7052_02745 [Lentisphaerae bacterium]|nr:hypothetical protein [Lentisphaerota bacterium]
MLLVYLAAFAFRNAVAERDLRNLEQTANCRFAPFLVESAVMYSYINKLSDGQDIAGVDPTLPGMKHYKVSEQMSLSLEYMLGNLLKLRRAVYGTPPPGEYENSYTESRFIRYCFTLYIALAPALLYLMLRWLKLPWFWAAAGAALEIFSAAALGRYTGQDLIKGAFAWPLLTAYLCCYAGALSGKFFQRKLLVLLTIAVSFAAMACWDASQIVMGLLAASGIITAIIWNQHDRRLQMFYLATFIGMMLATLTVPYLRSHNSSFSPAVMWIVPAAWAVQLLPPGRYRRCWQILLFALLAICWLLISKLSAFGGNYSHFSELLSAKLKFFNQLPADPTLLTFDQRYLWTPELHSASWQMTRMIYPAGLRLLAALWGISAIYLAVKFVKKHSVSRRQKRLLIFVGQFALLTAAAFIMYIFMARFRDITILFASIALPLTLAWLQRCSRSKVYLILLLTAAALAILAEWHNSRRLTRKYPEGLPQTAAMIKFMRQHDLSNKVILSDMQTSSYLKGYTNSSILVQPKYELPEVRQLTQDFILKLFNEPLSNFADFCAAHQVDYFLLHVPTVTTPANVPYSYRYMACANKLNKQCAAVRLGLTTNPGHNFCEIALPGNAATINGYRLYKFIPEAEYQRAVKLCEKALEAYYLNRHRRAARLVKKAYKLAPGVPDIYHAYVTITRTIPPQPSLPCSVKK